MFRLNIYFDLKYLIVQFSHNKCLKLKRETIKYTASVFHLLSFIIILENKRLLYRKTVSSQRHLKIKVSILLWLKIFSEIAERQLRKKRSDNDMILFTHFIGFLYKHSHIVFYFQFISEFLKTFFSRNTRKKYKNINSTNK